MPPDALTPLWWLARLQRKLRDQKQTHERFAAYYRGEHPLPWLPEQVRDVAQRILDMARSNYMGLVVDATAERLEVLGFRIGDSTDADTEAWRIWQANDLDSWSGIGFTEALTGGVSHLLVGPNPADEDTPLITVESPTQCVVEYQPGAGSTRAAGLKMWSDDITGRTMATLYLPDMIYKWQRGRGLAAGWQPRVPDGEEWPLPNPLGVVPLIELRNNPGLLVGGRSELTDVIPIQDRINKTLADRLVTQDFGAFPQKWASNWELSDDEIDDNGNAKPVQVNIGRDRLLRAQTEVKFGQFDAAPLDPYSAAKSEDVKDIASRTRVPTQYLLGDMVNVSADALQAAESGLVSKVLQRRRPYETALEEAVVLALRLAGKALQQAIHTIWRDPQYRSIAQLTDAVVKQYQAGLVPLDDALAALGKTPLEIARIKSQLRQDVLLRQALILPGVVGAETATTGAAAAGTAAAA